MTDRPHRVTLSSAKGWKMPLNTCVVTRRTVFGNPFKVEPGTTHQGAVLAFIDWLSGNPWACGDDKFEAKRAAIIALLPELRGKNLACWCKPDQICHADVLLKLANDTPHSAGVTK